MLRLRIFVFSVLVVGCVDLTVPPPLQVTPGTMDGPVVDVDARPVDVPPDTFRPPVVDMMAVPDTLAPDAEESDAPDQPDTFIDDAPPADADVDVGVGEDAPAPPQDVMPPPPDMMPDVALIENGKPCDSNAQCRLGNCVKGICCNTRCDQSCFSCNVTNLEGTCAAVPAGQMHATDCPVQAPATCGRDGTCDGSGRCRLYQQNTECAPVSCTSGIERAASSCDGAGMCKASTMTKDCAPMTCKGSTCASTCDGATPCQPGAYCDATQHCAPLLMNGAACTGDNQCSSTHCVEGVCCNTTCTQKCYSCKVTAPTNLTGTCSPAAAGSDPRSECLVQDPTTCGRAGGCDGTTNGNCRLHPNTTVCSPQICVGSTQSAQAMCNGLGTCIGGAQTDCGNYLCNGNVCRTTCGASTECKAGFMCTGTSCVPMLPGPVLYWKFDEATGGTANDSSGFNYHGSSTGVPMATGMPVPSTMVPPVVMFSDPRSLQFTASQHTAVRVTMPPAPEPRLRATNDITMSAWFRATAADLGTNGGEIISGGNSYLIRLRRGYMEVSKRIPGNKVAQCFSATMTPAQAATTFLNGNWHHLVGVSSTQGLKLYYDGAVVCDETTTDDKAPIAYDQGNDFWVGRHGNGQTTWDFGGNIDEVRLYNRVLSDVEILRLAQGNDF